MTNFLNLPTAEQFDVHNSLLASIASNNGGIKINNWEDLQRINRMGLGEKLLTVGDSFMANYNGVSYILDLIGINQDKPTDKKYQYSLTLQFRDCIMNAQFDAPEALYYAQEELPAGTYHFTDSATKYNFILTQPVPAGGCLTFPWAYNTDILTAKISSYPTQDSVAVIESVNISVGADGIELIDINDMNRCRYGSNNYKESTIREWLNSDKETYVWIPQTKYDRPSTGAPYTGGGFLKLLDPELAAVIGPVDKQVARNTITDGGGQDLFSDKVFLLSRVEVGLGAEGTSTGEAVYPYYNNITDTGRIKLLTGNPRYWWLRSPVVGYSYLTRHVNTSGALSYDSADSASGLSPACVII